MSEREMTASELLAMIFYYVTVAAAVYVTLWLVGALA